MTGGLDTRALKEELDHVLLFSQCFFRAFHFAKDRVRQWKFLALVCKTQVNGAFSLDDFAVEDIRAIAGLPRATQGYWEHRLIRGFRSPAGAFVESVRYDPNTARRRGKALEKPRQFALTPLFDAAVCEYVKAFFTLMVPDRPSMQQIAQIAPNKREFFKDLLCFQKNTYWRSYVALVASLCPHSEAPRTELTNHGPYWVLLLVLWRQFLQEPARLLLAPELDSNVRHTMISVNQTELNSCLSFLIKHRFISVADDIRPVRYGFNTRFEKIFRTYTQEIAVHRKELLSAIAAPDKLRAFCSAFDSPNDGPVDEFA